ncbi:MAG: RNA 3'-terminal phosphate cyclase [Lentisphaeraceae bacterium]|nr:RNA 3'-terminal phosphate cyclase [Lentisphaeraceae bacterium]
MSNKIYIDGSMGEGGGQVLRSSLSLSLITGKTLEIKNIRAGRKKPGLLRQHLTCIKAAKEICGATASGDNIKSTELVLNPGKVKSGHYQFSVGSAGSAILVLQTILPPLILAEGKSTVVLEGGTHNPMAPPYHFLEKCFIPILNKMGVTISTKLEKWGFNPAGGGRFTIEIASTTKLKSIELLERGELLSKEVEAISANIPIEIAKRETEILQDKLSWDKVREVTSVDSPGPGNIIMAKLKYENITELISEIGSKGTRAQIVANKLIRKANKYLSQEAPVGEYLADQLLLPFALSGGGSFWCTTISSHTRTNIEVIEKFLDVDIQTKEHKNGFLVTIN